MPDQSSNLALPFLMPAQAQKHVTVNESLLRLDALVQLAAVSATTTAQPASPTDGQCYILPSGKTGAAWGAMANGALAYCRDGVWEQLTPREGWRAFVKDTNTTLVHDGAAWIAEPVTLGDDQVTFAKLVNATQRALIGASGAGDFGEVPISANVLALLGAADYAAARALLDLEPGVDVRALATTREALTSDRIYYVRTDGNDSNTGLADTSGGAFLTIQKALDVVATIDFAGRTVTIQIADGTYSGQVVVPVTVGQANAANLLIQGNIGTPANVVVQQAFAFNTWLMAGANARCRVRGMTIQCSSSNGYGLQAYGSGVVEFSDVVFGPNCFAQILAEGGGVLQAVGNYTIGAGADFHVISLNAYVKLNYGVAVTLSGTPAFATAFAYANSGGVFYSAASGVSYSGAATGPRYLALSNGVIATDGGSATYLPGDASGGASSGGQYV